MIDLTDISEYVRGHLQRTETARLARQARHRQAEAQAAAMVRALTQQYAITQVWLFGSILHAELFDETSDIDLACAGLPQHRYLEAYGLLEDRGSIPFDLVTIETCAQTLADDIRRRGRLVYGAP